MYVINIDTCSCTLCVCVYLEFCTCQASSLLLYPKFLISFILRQSLATQLPKLALNSFYCLAL